MFQFSIVVIDSSYKLKHFNHWESSFIWKKTHHGAFVPSNPLQEFLCVCAQNYCKLRFAQSLTHTIEYTSIFIFFDKFKIFIIVSLHSILLSANRNMSVFRPFSTNQYFFFVKIIHFLINISFANSHCFFTTITF